MGTNQSREVISKEYIMRILPSIFTVFLFMVTSMTYSQESDTIKVASKPIKTDHTWDRLSISVGGLFSGHGSDITIGSENLGLGFSIDMERLLGLKITTWGLNGSAKFRFGKKRRSQLIMDYFGVSRTSKKVLGKDLEIGDIVIPLQNEITTRFQWKIITAKYDYAFYQDDRISLGVSAGLYLLPIKFSIEVVNIKGTTQNLFAPLPNIGFRSDVLITKKFYFNHSLDFLYLETNEFTGSILDFDFSLEFRPVKHLGICLGVNSTKWKLTSNGNSYPGVDFFGEIETGFNGFYINAKFSM